MLQIILQNNQTFQAILTLFHPKSCSKNYSNQCGVTHNAAIQNNILKLKIKYNMRLRRVKYRYYNTFEVVNIFCYIGLIKQNLNRYTPPPPTPKK